MSNDIGLDISEQLLANGCTHTQMTAVEEVLASVEHELAALHLQIHALRSIAHGGPSAIEHSFERYADSVLRSSNELLIAIRRQRDGVAGLVGKRKR